MKTPVSHRDEIHHQGTLQDNLKQLVYGGNDGIVTTFAIVAGFAGAGASGVDQIGALAVLVFGLANLFADAAAMGLGEFLSARSQRDVYDAQRAIELREYHEHPEQERDELVEMMTERGLSHADASVAADHIMKSPELVIDMMMSYELEMPDMRNTAPAFDGLVTFVAFLVFGCIPLIPYFLLDPTNSTFWLSVWATFGALVLLGILRFWATRERIFRCIGETVLVGGICAVLAFAVGAIVGG
ncbi:MAG: VIT1/CCC1 family predicted Fe2+/Mn2+ transporter [Paracoccaceae bacterium]